MVQAITGECTAATPQRRNGSVIVCQYSGAGTNNAMSRKAGWNAGTIERRSRAKRNGVGSRYARKDRNQNAPPRRMCPRQRA